MSDSALTRAEHEEFARRMENEHEYLERRITLIEEDIRHTQELTISVKEMAVSMNCMLEEQKKQGKRLETLENVPKKNFDTFKYAIFGAVGTALGGAIVTMFLNFMK